MTFDIVKLLVAVAAVLFIIGVIPVTGVAIGLVLLLSTCGLGVTF